MQLVTTLLLNIGRDKNDGSGRLGWDMVHHALTKRGLFVERVEEQTSATEQTYIVRCHDQINSIPYVKARLSGLAFDLKQDCIAAVLLSARHPTEPGDFPGVGIHNGELFGPLREKWAPFNPQFFLTFA